MTAQELASHVRNAFSGANFRLRKGAAVTVDEETAWNVGMHMAEVECAGHRAFDPCRAHHLANNIHECTILGVPMRLGSRVMIEVQERFDGPFNPVEALKEVLADKELVAKASEEARDIVETVREKQRADD